MLYIDGVGPFGGASRSLFEAVRALRPIGVEPYFLATRGTSIDFYRTEAAELIATRGLSRFDNTLYSHYRGKRWLVLLRETFLLPSTGVALLRARRQWRDFDVIHVNEILELGPAILAKRIFGAPLVVHVRSVQNNDPSSRRYQAICDLLRRHADAVIAIDENVRLSLPSDIAVDVIHNGFTPQTADRDLKMIARFEQLRPSSLKVGFVGNLHHSKGLFEMLEAAKRLQAQGVDFDMVLVGGTTISDVGLKARAIRAAGLAQNVRQQLEQRATELGVADRIHFFGPTRDITSVYDRIDVLCFASHYNAPGRPVFEAAFSGVPSITAVTEPRSDTLRPYETGIAISPRDSAQLANAVRYFAERRQEVTRMGGNARALAEANFDPRKNAQALLDIYQRISNQSPKEV